MKFVRFNGGKTGLVVERAGLQVIDIAENLISFRDHDPAASEVIATVLPGAGDGIWTAMIGEWDKCRDAFASFDHWAQSGLGGRLIAFDAVALEAPIASPAAHIFALGSNTTVHIIRAMKAMLDLDLTEEQALRSKREGLPPFGFTVWPATIVGHGAIVTPPRGTQAFDYEGECVVYVKAGGRYLETVDVWGYTAFNDFGVRDTHLKLAKQAELGPFSFNTPKNFDTGKACGPWVVVDEGHDIASLRCVLTVNGAVRQDWALAEMIYGFDETLSYLSQNMTLRPGDMLASGTGAGVAIEGGVTSPNWLEPGDVVEVQLGGAGALRSVVGSWT